MAITEDLIAKIEIETSDSEKNISSLSREIAFLDKQIKNLSADIGKVFSSDVMKKAAISTSKEIKSLDGNLKSLDRTISLSERSIDNFGSEARIQSRNVNYLIITIDNLVNIFRNLTSKENLENLSKILKILSFVAKVKGYDSLSEQLKTASVQVNNFKETLSKNVEGNFLDDALSKISLFDKAMLGLKIAAISSAAAISAVFISKIPGSMDVTKNSLVSLSTFIKNASVGPLDKLDKSFIKTSETIRNKFNPGVFGIIEASLLLSPALIGVGRSLQNAESEAIQFTGKIVLLAGILVGGLGAAVIMATAAISNLAISLGGNLIRMIGEFEAKAMKAESTLKLFEFTIKGFNKELGVGATGSLELWNDTLTNVADNSVFSAESIRKSIKIMVAEGQALNLSVSENQEILKRAADIATISGENLEDVIVKIVQGISGNSQALIALGINVSKTGLEHGKLIKTMGKSLSAMSDSEIQTLRLNEVFEQTKPLVGAAAAALDTITGANIKYEQSISVLQIALGSQSSITSAYTNVLTSLVRHLSSLPKIMLDITGAFLDFSGVALIILGTIAKYGLTIVTLTGAFHFLSGAIATNISLQTVLFKVFSFSAKIIGVQAIAVTSLSTAWANMALIMKTILIGSLKSVMSVIVSLTKTVWALTATLLKNPLFWTVGGVVVIILLVVEAYKQLENQLKSIDSMMISNTKTVKDNTSIWTDLGKFVSMALLKVIGFVKLSIIGMLQLWEATKLGANGWKLLTQTIFGSKKAAEETKTAAFNNLISLNELGKTAEKTWVEVLLGLENTANAAEETKTKFQELSKEMAKIQLPDLASDLKIEIFGTESQKNILAYQKSNIELNRLFDKQGKDLEEIQEIEKKIAESRANQGKLFLTLQKSQMDISKDFENIRQNAFIKQLEDSGMLVEAEKLKQIEIRNSFNKQLESAKKYAEITGLPVKGIKETIKALENQKIAAIEAAQVKQDEKRLKPLLEDLKAITEQTRKFNEENLRHGDTALQGINAVKSARLKEINDLREKIKLQGLINDQNNQQLNDAIQSVEQKSRIEIDGIGGLVSFAADFDDIFKTNTINMADSINSAFQNSAQFIGPALEGAWDFVATLFDPDAIKGLADSISSLIKDLPQILDQAFNSLIDAFQNLIENLPEIIDGIFAAVGNALSKIFQMLPDLIDSLVDSLTDFIERLPEIFSQIFEALPGIIDKIFERLPDLIDSIFMAIPQIITSLIQAIPDIITNIADRLPKIIEQFIAGFIGAISEIAVAIIDLITGGGLEKIFMAIMRMIPRAVLAIVEGILKGVKRGLQAIFSGIKIPVPSGIAELPKKIEEGAKNLAKNFAKESSKVFKVLDLEAEAKSLKDAKSITDVIESTFKIGTKFIEGTWAKFIKLLKKAWLWIWDNVLEPIVSIHKKAWMWVLDNVIQPLLDGIMSVWTWVADNIFRPVLEGFTNVFNTINESIFKPLINGITNVFNIINDTIFKPLTDLVKGAFQPIIDFFTTAFQVNVGEAFTDVFIQFEEIGTKIGTAFKNSLNDFGEIFTNLGTDIWNGLKTGIDTLGEFFKNMFDTINPANLFAKIFKVDHPPPGTVEKTLGINIPFLTFADGGMVPGSPVVQGDSLKNDRILAALSPGEAVVPRSIMNNPQLSALIKAVLDGDINPQGLAFGGTFKKLAKGDIQGVVGDVSSSGKEVFSDATDFIQDVLTGPLKELWAKVKDIVFNKMMMKMFEANKFHSGGLVRGFASGGEVPSMLQPGEFVVNRNAVNSLGAQFLGQMNKTGQSPTGQNTTINITMNIEASSQSLDESYVRNKLIPSLKDELKRSSLRGEFLIGERGIRKA